MNRGHVMLGALVLLAVEGEGCGAPAAVEGPPVPGRRLQGAQVVAQGAVPYQVGAYELVFAQQPAADPQVRRAALLVDLVGGQGQVRGFVEWGRREPPMMYAVGGLAWQRTVQGEAVTVLELSLHCLEPRRGCRAGDAGNPAYPALRVVVNERSGDVTASRRR
jgi:hypothetical protein